MERDLVPGVARASSGLNVPRRASNLAFHPGFLVGWRFLRDVCIYSSFDVSSAIAYPSGLHSSRAPRSWKSMPMQPFVGSWQCHRTIAFWLAQCKASILVFSSRISSTSYHRFRACLPESSKAACSVEENRVSSLHKRNVRF